MNDKLFFIAISVALLFEGAFFFALSLIYKSQEKKSLRLLNTFLFEVTPSFNEKYSYINYFLFFGIAVSIFPYVYYVAYNVNTFSMTIMILSVLLAFCLASLPFISLNKLREHFYLALGGLVSLFSLYVMEAYYCGRLYFVFYQDAIHLVAMIVSLIFAAFVLFMIVNPKLFDLKNDKDESGRPVRKKFIFLAFSELILYPLSILALLPILLISIQ